MYNSYFGLIMTDIDKTKIDRRKNNGGHRTAGRKPKNTQEIQPRPTLETIRFIQEQVTAQKKTQGQIVDWMTDITREYLNKN